MKKMVYNGLKWMTKKQNNFFTKMKLLLIILGVVAFICTFLAEKILANPAPHDDEGEGDKGDDWDK